MYNGETEVVSLEFPPELLVAVMTSLLNRQRFVTLTEQTEN